MQFVAFFVRICVNIPCIPTTSQKSKTCFYHVASLFKFKSENDMLSGYHVWSDQVFRWLFSFYICKCWPMPWFVKKNGDFGTTLFVIVFFNVGEVPVPSLLNGESFLVSWLLGRQENLVDLIITNLNNPVFWIPNHWKEEHQYSTPFSPNISPFCEFSWRYLWWLFLQGSTCINQWGNCRWYTVSCARWLAFGFFGWSV